MWQSMHSLLLNYFLWQDYLLLSFNKGLKQNFPLPIKSAEGKQYSQWEQTRAGHGSPCHHTDILLRETGGYNGRLEGGSIGVPKGRPTWYSCPWFRRQGTPSLQHLRGQGPSAAEAWAAGRGWEQSAGVEAHRGSQGGAAEGNPDVDPNDALGSVRVHTCVWELFMLF